MSKIKEAIIRDKKAFIPFLVTGHPTEDVTLATMKTMAANGATVIELGIPFSDPVAEGPVIEAADVVALKAGTTLDSAFTIVKTFKQECATPVVFLTYANPVYHYGYDDFFARCQKDGVDGIIIPDIPYEEKEEVLPYAKKYGVDLITLIAPTSADRVRTLAAEATGYIYLVSSLGVTGERETITTDLKQIVTDIRKVTDTPVAIGFGIGTVGQARTMGAVSDGVIVGSAIVRRMTDAGEDSPTIIGDFTEEMVTAIKETILEN